MRGDSVSGAADGAAIFRVLVAEGAMAQREAAKLLQERQAWIGARLPLQLQQGASREGTVSCGWPWGWRPRRGRAVNMMASRRAARAARTEQEQIWLILEPKWHEVSKRKIE